MPAHDLVDYSKYQFTDPTRGLVSGATVMSSRGCPFDCRFCCHDRNLRLRRVEDVVREIEYLYRVGNVRYFLLCDDTFLVGRQRVLDLANGIKDLDISDANFQCQSRAELVEPEIIERLREANFVRMSLGVESGSQEVLDRCRKGVRKEMYSRACRFLAEGGLKPRGSFIIGHPYETHESVRQTVDFAKELDLLEANFTVMTPYPGTGVYEMALRNDGLRFTRPEYATQWQAYRRWGNAIVETDELSAGDLDRLRQDAVAEFYSQDKVFQFFQEMFARGNRSSYFYRPVNFAWRRRFGRDVPFWDQLSPTEYVNPE